MSTPDDNSFEIAQRLDKYGAGKGPTRTPSTSQGKPPKKAIRSSPGRNDARRIRRIFWLLAVGAAVYWWLSTSEKPVPSRSRPGQVQAPSSEPPRTIPALRGEGTVPAFTVQVPGESTPSSASQNAPKAIDRAGD